MQPGGSVYRLSKASVMLSSSSSEDGDKVADLQPRASRQLSGRNCPSEGGESNASAGGPPSIASTTTERTLMKDTLDTVRRKLTMMSTVSPPRQQQASNMAPATSQPRLSSTASAPASVAGIPKLEGLLTEVVGRLSKIEGVYTDMSGKLSRMDLRTAENERSVKELQHISAGTITETARLVDIMGANDSSRGATPKATAGRSSRVPSQNPSVAGNVQPESQQLSTQVSSTIHQHASQIHKLVAGLDFLEQHILRQDQVIESMQQQLGMLSSKQGGASAGNVPNELLLQVHNIDELTNKLRSQLYKVDKKVGSTDGSMQVLAGHVQAIAAKVDHMERAHPMSADLATLSAAQAEVHHTVDNLQHQMQEMQQQMQELKAGNRAAAAAQTVSHSQPGLSELKAELTSLREEVQQLSVEPAPASVGQVHQLAAEMAALREEVATILTGATSKALSSASSPELQQLKATIQQLKAENERVSQQVVTTEALVSELKPKISMVFDLSAKVSELAPLQKVAVLESDMAWLRQRLTGVTKTVDDQLASLQQNSAAAAAAGVSGRSTGAASPRRPLDDASASPAAPTFHQLQQAVERLAASMQDVEGRITAVDAASAVGQVRQQEADAQMKALKQSVEEMASRNVSQLAVAQNTFRGVTDKLSNEIQAVKADSSTLAGEIAALWTNAGTLTDNLDGTKGNLITLTTDVQGVKVQVGELHTQLRQTQEGVGSLRQEVAGLVTGTLTPLSDSLDGVKAGVEMHTRELQQVRGDLNGLTSGLQQVRNIAAADVLAVKSTVQGLSAKMEDARNTLSTQLQATGKDLEGLSASLLATKSDVSLLENNLQQAKGETYGELQLVKAGLGAHSGQLQMVKQKLASQEAADAADPVVTNSKLNTATQQLMTAVDALRGHMEGNRATGRLALDDLTGRHEQVAGKLVQLKDEHKELGEQTVELQAQLQLLHMQLQEAVTSQGAKHAQLATQVIELDGQSQQLAEQAAEHGQQQTALAGRFNDLEGSVTQEHQVLHAAVTANSMGVDELKTGLDDLLALVQDSVAGMQTALQQTAASLQQASEAHAQQLGQELSGLTTQMQDAHRAQRVISGQVVDLAAQLDTELQPRLAELATAQAQTQAALDALTGKHEGTQVVVDQLVSDQAGLSDRLEVVRGGLEECQTRMGDLATNVQVVGLAGLVEELQAAAKDTAGSLEQLKGQLASEYYISSDRLAALLTARDDMQAAVSKLQGVLQPQMQQAKRQTPPPLQAASSLPSTLTIQPAPVTSPSSTISQNMRDEVRAQVSGLQALEQRVAEMQAQVQLALYRSETMVRQDQLSAVQRTMMALELQVKDQHGKVIQSANSLGLPATLGTPTKHQQVPAAVAASGKTNSSDLPAPSTTATASKGNTSGSVSEPQASSTMAIAGQSSTSGSISESHAELTRRLRHAEQELAKLSNTLSTKLLPAVDTGLPDLRKSVQDLQLMLFDLRGAGQDGLATPRSRLDSANGAVADPPAAARTPSRLRSYGLPAQPPASEASESVRVFGLPHVPVGEVAESVAAQQGTDDEEETAARRPSALSRSYHSFAAPDGSRGVDMCDGDDDEQGDNRLSQLTLSMQQLQTRVEQLENCATGTAAAAGVNSGAKYQQEQEDLPGAAVSGAVVDVGSSQGAAGVMSAEFTDAVDHLTSKLAELEGRVFSQAGTLQQLTDSMGLTVELGHQVQVLAEQVTDVQVITQPYGQQLQQLQEQVEELAAAAGQDEPVQSIQQRVLALEQKQEEVSRQALELQQLTGETAALHQEMTVLSSKLRTVLEPVGQLQEGILDQLQQQHTAVQAQLAEYQNQLQALQQHQAPDAVPAEAIATRLQKIELELATAAVSAEQLQLLQQQVQTLRDQTHSDAAGPQHAELQEQLQQLTAQIEAVKLQQGLSSQASAAGVTTSTAETDDLHRQLQAVQQQLDILEQAHTSHTMSLRCEIETLSTRWAQLEPLQGQQQGPAEQLQVQFNAVQGQLSELTDKVQALVASAGSEATAVKQEFELVHNQISRLQPLGQQLQQQQESTQELSRQIAAFSATNASAAPAEAASQQSTQEVEQLKSEVQVTTSTLQQLQQQVQLMGDQVAALATAVSATDVGSARLSASNIEALQGTDVERLARVPSSGSLGSFDVVTGLASPANAAATTGFGLQGAGMGATSILSSLPAAITGGAGGAQGNGQQRFLQRLLDAVRRQSSRLHAQFGSDQDVESQLAQVDQTLTAVAQQLEAASASGSASSHPGSSATYAEAMVTILEQVAALRSIGPKTHGPAVQQALAAHEAQLQELHQLIKEVYAATAGSPETIKALADRLTQLEGAVSTLQQQHVNMTDVVASVTSGQQGQLGGGAALEAVETKLAEYGKVLQALRNRIVTLQEHVENTQGVVKDMEAVHGSVVLRLSTLETDLVAANAAGTAAGSVGAAGHADIAPQLSKLQGELASLEVRVAELAATQVQVQTSLETTQRVGTRVDALDTRNGELSAKMVALGQTMPVLAGELKNLERNLQTRLELCSSQLSGLCEALADIGRLEKPDSKNPFAGMGGAGNNPTVKLLETKVETLRSSLASVADRISSDFRLGTTPQF